MQVLKFVFSLSEVPKYCEYATKCTCFKIEKKIYLNKPHFMVCIDNQHIVNEPLNFSKEFSVS